MISGLSPVPPPHYTSNLVNTPLLWVITRQARVTRVPDYPGHVLTRGGQVLLYHIYTLSTPPQMSGSRAATCLKNRVWEQTLEIIKNNIQQKQSTHRVMLPYLMDIENAALYMVVTQELIIYSYGSIYTPGKMERFNQKYGTFKLFFNTRWRDI